MFTDSHCHLEKEYYADLDVIIENAKNNDVNRMITSGSSHETNKETIEVCKKFENVYGTLGIHPHDVLNVTEEHYNFIENNISNPKIVAIGEIGLDYYYGKDTKERQKEVFERQLNIAEKHNMPVVIHSREAVEDTINILKKFKVNGVIHSFSGSYETALIYIKMGYKLGINGVITFSNSKLSDVIEKISLEYIVLETDCPYLTPVPFRGQKNEPKNILEIAKFISNLKEISTNELAKITNENIATIFDI